jgi:uncharacterized membrane protein
MVSLRDTLITSVVCNTTLREHMNSSSQSVWARMVILIGAIYFVVGYVFAKFAGMVAFNQSRLTWNRLAFIVCAVAFAFHIAYEHYRVRSTAKITAWHTGLAAALGGLMLAVAANIHDLGSASGYRSRLLIALVVWPLLTGVPAFILALLTAAGLTVIRRRA